MNVNVPAAIKVLNEMATRIEREIEVAEAFKNSPCGDLPGLNYAKSSGYLKASVEGPKIDVKHVLRCLGVKVD